MAEWYADGLRFECQPDCGGCCTTHGDHAYVYLTGADERAISRELGIGLAEFRREYTAVDDGDRVLRMDQADCPFLDGHRCTVYDVRPLQCRTFPFWTENVASRAAWRRVARFCPGIDRGPVHPLRVIRSRLAEREEGR